MKKTISILLSLVLLIGLLPAGSLAADTVLTVDGTDYSDLSENLSGEGWHWDAAKETLTLNGYEGGAIRSTGKLSLVLENDSVLTADEAVGLEVGGTLHIGGDGYMKVYTVGEPDAYGIRAEDSILIENEADLYIYAGGSRSATGLYSCRGDVIIRENACVWVEAEAQATQGAPVSYSIHAGKAVTLETSCDIYCRSMGAGEAYGIKAGTTLAIGGDGEYTVSAYNCEEETDGRGDGDAYGLSVGGDVTIGDTAAVYIYSDGTGYGYGLAFAEQDGGSLTVADGVRKVDVEASTRAVRFAKGITAKDFIQTGAPEEQNFCLRATGGVHTLTLDANGGTALTMMLTTGEDGTCPRLHGLDAVRSGNYRFIGWYNRPKGGLSCDEDTIFTQDTTLYAQWSAATPPVIHGGLYARKDGQYGIPTAPISVEPGVVTLYAKADTDAYCNVMLSDSTGRKTYLAIDLKQNEYYAVTINPIPGSTTLVWLDIFNWEEGGDVTSNVVCLRCDTEAPALPQRPYTVTFDPGEGKLVGEKTVTASLLPDAMPTAVREGYSFDGWYTAEGELFNGGTVTQNMTVTAQWSKEAPQKELLELKLYLKIDGQYVMPTDTIYYPEVVDGTLTAYLYTDKPIEMVRIKTFGEDYNSSNNWGDLKKGYNAIPVDICSLPAYPTKISVYVEDDDTYMDSFANTLSIYSSQYHTVYEKSGIDFFDHEYRIAVEDEFDPDDYAPTIYGDEDFLGWYLDEALTVPAVKGKLTEDITIYAKYGHLPLPFTDVKEDDWFYPGVRYCYKQSLMQGTGETLFSPNSKVTRAQLVTILYRMLGGVYCEGDCEYSFTDVPEDTWYAEAVNWAASLGYVNGVGNGRFNPNGIVTREQIAAILYRASFEPEPEGNLSDFSDGAQVSDYAVDAMRWAVGAQIITGIDTGNTVRLSPNTGTTRAQIATIVRRFNT